MKNTGNPVGKLQEEHKTPSAPPAETWAGGYRLDSSLWASTEQVLLTENSVTRQTTLEV
ncbi:MAG: hypothetical protein GY696_29250 [Gammaproteobacteria bacterium]|nr:hypothetical protein [Gammaproteobacteria bacterium]